MNNKEYFDINTENEAAMTNLAVDKYNRLTCCQDIKCSQCKFFSSTSCMDRRKQWLEEKYDDRYVISKEVKVILENLDSKWKWIADTGYGIVAVYDTKPTKVNDFWEPTHEFETLNMFNQKLFSFFCMNDGEPIRIQELLENSIVEQKEREENERKFISKNKC